MDRNTVDWKGYIPALTTPFHKDRSLDTRGWQELLEWMVAQGMHGVAVAGSTGEWFSLRPQERKELFRLAARQIRGRLTVLGGCNAFTPEEAIDYAQSARDFGLDGILLSPPPYVVPTEREILAFYQAVSDAVSIPICLYNWPRGTNVDFETSTVLKLAEIENVVAIKNSTGSLARFLETFFAVRHKIRYFGFLMDELGLTLVRHQGGDGTIGAGAVLGRDHPDFFNHIWAGDLEKARRCGERDRALFKMWLTPDYSSRFGSSQAVFKAALNMLGLPGGYPRPPIHALTEEEIDQVAESLKVLDLLPATARNLTLPTA